jgi:preprotein translocase subunit YajC
LANSNDIAFVLGQFTFFALLAGVVFLIIYLPARHKKKKEKQKQNDSLLD